MSKKHKPELRNSNYAVAYSRVSSKNQADNTSLDTQGKNCTSYASHAKLTLDKEFGGVESAWGKVERKEFNRMIDYVKKNNKIGHIIFDFQDRMTRNFRDQIKIEELISNYGIQVHFARSKEIYGTNATSDQKFMITINGAVNKKLSDDISMKTAIGMRERAEQGWYPAYAPVGYLNKDNVIVVDEEKAPLIQEAFTSIADPYSSLSILADKMYAKGLRTRRGKRMSDKSLQKMFENKMYYGIFEWGGKEYVGKHTPIITKEIYERADTALSSRNACVHKSPRNHPFANLIDCPLCNHRLVGDAKGTNKMYYRCSSSPKRHAGQKIKYLTENELLTQAENIVKKVSVPKNTATWIQKCVDREVARLLNTDNKEIIKLKKQLTATETKLQDLKDNGLEKGYAAEFINYNLEKYKKEITDYQMQISSLQTALNPSSIIAKSVDITQFVCNLGYVFNSADKHKKAELLRKLGERYAYDYDPKTKAKNLLVVYREPFNFFVEGNKNREAVSGSPYTNWSKNSNSVIWGG